MPVNDDSFLDNLYKNQTPSDLVTQNINNVSMNIVDSSN